MRKCPECGKPMELEVGTKGSSYVCRAYGCMNNPDFAEIAAEDVAAEVVEEAGEDEAPPSGEERYGVGPIP